MHVRSKHVRSGPTSTAEGRLGTEKPVAEGLVPQRESVTVYAKQMLLSPQDAFKLVKHERAVTGQCGLTKSHSLLL